MIKRLLLLMLFASTAFAQNKIDLTTMVTGVLPLANGGRGTCSGNGSFSYWNGAAWVCFAGNNSGTNVLAEDASGNLSWVAGGGGAGLSGTQYSSVYLATSSTAGYATPPTTKGYWFLGYNLTSDAAAAPTAQQVGFAARAVSGGSDTILWSDNNSEIEYTDGGAVAVALPTATTLENPGFAVSIVNLSGSATDVTVTPASWTINGGSTLVISEYESCFIYVDAAGTAWHALCHTTSQHP